MAPAGGAEKTQLVATALTQRPFYPTNRASSNSNLKAWNISPGDQYRLGCVSENLPRQALIACGQIYTRSK